MPHSVHGKEGEVQDIPFVRNEMKDQAPTMGRLRDDRGISLGSRFRDGSIHRVLLDRLRIIGSLLKVFPSNR